MKKQINFKKYIVYSFVCLTIFLGSIFVGLSLSSKTQVYAYKTNQVQSTNGLANTYSAASPTTMQFEIEPPSSDYYCLMDTDLMIIENQLTLGLCWNFAANKALESYLQKTTGIVYDFSESWISVCARVENSGYIVGAGSDFTNFWKLATKYGLLFEEEFPYDFAYNTDNSNYQELFDNYKDLAHKEIVNGLDSVYFGSLGDEMNTYIKKYLVNYGALSISFDASKIVTNEGKKYSYAYRRFADISTINGHSVTLIGWDDNVTFTDCYGTTRTGAFITLNSWGTTSTDNEVIYLAYDDPWLKYTIYGFKEKESTSVNLDTKIVSSNAKIYNYEVGKYNPDENTISTDIYDSKNIFFYGQLIDLDIGYEFLNNNTSSSLNVQIYKDNVDVSSLFSRHYLNKTSKLYEIETSRKIDSGVYQVVFGLDIDNDEVIDENHIVQIKILSGAEMCFINTNAFKDIHYTYQNFNKVNSTENENYIFGYTSEAYSLVEFEVSNISKITSVECLNNKNMVIHSSYNSLQSATNSSYSKNRIYIQIYSPTLRERVENRLKINTIDGYSIYYTIYTYTLDIEQGDQKAYVFYNCNDGRASSDMFSYWVINTNLNLTLNDPVSNDEQYSFSGWYVDKEFTTRVVSNGVEDNINSQAKLRNNDNYWDNQLNGRANYYNNYIFVYAKYDIQVFHLDAMDLGEVEYGDFVNVQLNNAYNGVVVSYQIDSNTLPEGLTLLTIDENRYLNGNPLTIGTFEIKYTATDSSTGEEISTTITIKVNKRKLGYMIEDKTSSYGEPIKELTAKLYKGTIYNNDELNLRLFCDVSPQSEAGNYTIYGVYNNDKYEITFIKGTYKITKSEILYTSSNCDITYDGNYHGVTVEILNMTDNVTIEYSLDGVEYQLEPILQKDYTNGKIAVYVRLSCENYDSQVLNLFIQINKKQVNIVWSNTNLTYNKSMQKPSATCNELVSGETAVINVAGEQINAGNYSAIATIDSDNYQIVNSTTNFTINKATLTSDDIVDEIRLDMEQVYKSKTVSDITLPKGFVWQDADQVLEYGDNVCYLKFIPEDLNYEELTNIRIIVNKPTNNSYVTKIVVIAVICGVILASLISLITSLSHLAYERKIAGKQNKKTQAQKVTKEDEMVIYFVTNSPITLAPIKSVKRMSVALPQLERRYYEFGGWYKDNLFIEKYNNNGYENSLTLYAKWLPKF